LLAGTKITMADGSIKNVEDVHVGDVVKSWNHPTLIDESNENWFTDWSSSDISGSSTESSTVKSMKIDAYFKWHTISLSDGTELRCTFEHIFLVKKEGSWRWMQAIAMEPGQSMLKEDGSEVTIQSNVIAYTPVTTFNFDVEETDTYYAEGLVTHNVLLKDSNEKMIL
jgi:hypothetical protein